MSIVRTYDVFCDENGCAEWCIQRMRRPSRFEGIAMKDIRR